MSILKSDLEKLYSLGKSMPNIARELKCSPNKVVYWMKQHNISRRSRSDAAYLINNPKGDPFNLNGINTLSRQDMFLLGLSIGLYWGEGEKTTKHAIRVTNSDPYVILRFRDFLTNICKLETSKIRYYLICFNDIDQNVAKKYWSNLLQISPDKFGKIVVIPTQGKGTYNKKSKYGVCTIYAGNMKLKSWILEEINKLRQN